MTANPNTNEPVAEATGPLAEREQASGETRSSQTNQDHPLFPSMKTQADHPTQDAEQDGLAELLRANLPEYLKTSGRFTLWRLEVPKGGEKPTKVPYDAEGFMTDVNRPGAGTSFDDALVAYSRGGFNGIGLILSKELGVTVLDIDGCRNPDTGVLDPLAEDVIEKLDGHTEVSQSGTGVHVYMLGSLESDPGEQLRSRVRGKLNLEIYDEKRYMVVTGQAIRRPGELTEGGEVLADFHRTEFTTRSKQNEAVDQPKTRKMSDEEVLIRARDRGEDRFDRLWSGDIGEFGNPSSADQSLVNMLVFWTQDEDQIDRLFQRSGLARDKWLNREDYRRRTIATAMSSIRPYGAGGVDTSDVDNAWRLWDRYRNVLKWNDTTKKWLFYDGKRWVLDERSRARRFAHITADAISKETTGVSVNDERYRKILNHCRASKNTGRLRAMLEEYKALDGVSVTTADFDALPNLLNCQNGTLDTDTLEWHDHRAEDMLSKITNGAYVEGLKLELWDGFLGGLFTQRPDEAEELLSFMQQAVGYSLTGETTEDMVLLVVGGGGSGKTTLFETVAAALGSYAINTKPETFLTDFNRSSAGASEDIVKLVGARFVYGLEPDANRRFDAARLKSVSGADTLSARALYQSEIQFRPQFTLWLAMNSSPKVDADDGALWRRLVRLPLENAREEREGEGQPDPTYKRELLKPEVSADAVLTWAIDGLKAYREGGSRLVRPQGLIESTQTLRNENDSTAAFFREELEFTGNLKDKTRLSLVRSAYERFVEEDGGLLVGSAKFKQKLEAAGAVVKRTAVGRDVLGVKLADYGFHALEGGFPRKTG